MPMGPQSADSRIGISRASFHEIGEDGVKPSWWSDLGGSRKPRGRGRSRTRNTDWVHRIGILQRDKFGRLNITKSQIFGFDDLSVKWRLGVLAHTAAAIGRR